MAEREMPSPQNIHSNSTAYCPTSTAHPGQNDATAIIPVSTSVVVPAAPSHAIVLVAASHAIVPAATFKAIVPAASSQASLPAAVSQAVLTVATPHVIVLWLLLMHRFGCHFSHRRFSGRISCRCSSGQVTQSPGRFFYFCA